MRTFVCVFLMAVLIAAEQNGINMNISSFLLVLLGGTLALAFFQDIKELTR